MRLFKYSFFLGLLSVSVFCVFLVVTYRRTSVRKYAYEKPEDFDGFDNVSGTHDGCYIVPNVVHFVRFDTPRFTFVDAVCVLAAFKNQNPEKIVFHTNSNFTGKYWRVLGSVDGLRERMFVEKTDKPDSVFGQPLSRRFLNYHAGDVARLRILMKYGGIYLDNDSYIVRSLDDFRRYEMTLGWREGGNISNQVIISHKESRFLRHWLSSYNGHYDPKSWFYNAGIRPTQEVLAKRPELVHRVTKKLAEFGNTFRIIYLTRSNSWKEHYAIHLLINHQRELLKKKPVHYDDTNIRNYNISLRDMVEAVYPFN